MKKRIFMAVATAAILCCVATVQFLKTQTTLLEAQESVLPASEGADPDTTATDSSQERVPTVSSSVAQETEPSADSSEEASAIPSASSASSSESSAAVNTWVAEPPEGSSEAAESTESTENMPNDVEKKYKFSISQNTTTLKFLASIKEDAQQIARENDLYTSVMLAQAILESGSGNSKLAQKPNFNLFGIKGAYKGASITFATQEDNGSGGLYTINAAFRKYPGVKESLEDYAKLLRREFYKGAWKSKTTSYHDATKFLTGRYATDTTYNKKLDALIEAYHLTDFDTKPVTKAKAAAVEARQKNNEIKTEPSDTATTQKTTESEAVVEIVAKLDNLKPEYSYEETPDSEPIAEKTAKEIKVDVPVNQTNE